MDDEEVEAIGDNEEEGEADGNDELTLARRRGRSRRWRM